MPVTALRRSRYTSRPFPGEAVCLNHSTGTLARGSCKDAHRSCKDGFQTHGARP
uniref:Uncharacterized protein n=1 Tax=Burkholderia sp. (strain CCGE1003) TaxID=640512 RepID=E1T4M2_BURSG